MESPHRHCLPARIPPYDLGSLPGDVLDEISKKLEIKTALRPPGYKALATCLGVFNQRELWKLDEVEPGQRAMEVFKACLVNDVTLDIVQVGLETIGSVAAEIIPTKLDYIIDFVDRRHPRTWSWYIPGSDPQENTESFSSLPSHPFPNVGQPHADIGNTDEGRQFQYNLERPRRHRPSSVGRGRSQQSRPTAASVTVVKQELRGGNQCTDTSNLNLNTVDKTNTNTGPSLSCQMTPDDHLGCDANMLTAGSQQSGLENIQAGQFACTCSHQSSTSHRVSHQQPSSFHQYNSGLHQQHDESRQLHFTSHRQTGNFHLQVNTLNEPANISHHQSSGCSQQDCNINQHYSAPQQQSSICHQQSLNTGPASNNFHRGADNLHLQTGYCHSQSENYKPQICNSLNGVASSYPIPSLSPHRSTHDSNIRSSNREDASSNSARPCSSGLSEHNGNCPHPSNNVAELNNYREPYYGKQRHFQRGLDISNETSDEESGPESIEDGSHDIRVPFNRRHKVHVISSQARRPRIFVTGGNCSYEMAQISSELKSLEQSLGVIMDLDRHTLTPGEGKWKKLFYQADFVLIGVTKSYVSAVRNTTSTWTTRAARINDEVQGELLFRWRSDNKKFFTVIFTDSNLKKSNLPPDLNHAPYKWPNEKALLQARLQDKIQSLF